MLKYSCCSGVSSVSRARSVMPMIPFIGVRISWLMLARNSLFARFAASAASLACRNSASDRLPCVISLLTPTIPTISLCWLVKGTLDMRIHRTFPSALTADRSPSKDFAALMTSRSAACNAAARSFGNRSKADFPNKGSGDSSPWSLANALFASRYRPSESFAKILSGILSTTVLSRLPSKASFFSV